MLAFYQRYWRTGLDILLLVATAFGLMALLSYLYEIGTPIFFSILIFICIEPFAKFLNRRGIRKSIASGISVLLFTLTVLSVLTAIGFVLAVQIMELQENIPNYTLSLQKAFTSWFSNLRLKADVVSPDLLTEVNRYINVATSKGAQIAGYFFSKMISMLTSFSTFLFHFFIGIVLAYFLSCEVDRWRNYAIAYMPTRFKEILLFLKENVFRGLLAYVKAQIKLISISFVLIFVGLLILNVPNVFSISLFAALLDLAPLVGVPLLFIPWAIYMFIIGDTFLGVSLLVLLAVSMIIRQILEPKITGNTIGVSPYTMLSFIIISLSLFGVIGLVLSPVFLILIKALYKQGYVNSWITSPFIEQEES